MWRYADSTADDLFANIIASGRGSPRNGMRKRKPAHIVWRSVA